MGKRRIAIVYCSLVGAGGLGVHAGTVIAAFARGGDSVVAIGLGRQRAWPLNEGDDGFEAIDINPRPLRGWRVARTPLRWRSGLVQWVNDVALGRAAAKELDCARPDLVYVFTQAAAEVLAWCQARGVPSILDNPNGHIRNYAAICEREWRAWCGGRYDGHPVPAMVRRVEGEYALADWVRVSSEWSKRSLVNGGVPARRIGVVDLALDLARFSPDPTAKRGSGAEALRVAYVGSVNVRKGVFHLLRALRVVRARAKLVIVGNTGTRAAARVLARESAGLDVTIAPGDPVPAYRASDLVVLPSLEDGFGFVVAEAMACGVPVVVTDQCGSADWVARAEAGWVVPAGDAGALARAIEEADARRDELAAMGARGRAYVETRAASERCFAALRDFAWETGAEPGSRAR